MTAAEYAANTLPTPDSAGLIDRRVLDQLLEDVGPENAEAILDSFLREIERQSLALEEAAERSDLTALGRAAHRMKSSAASFGALRLSGLLGGIEQAAYAGESAVALGSMAEYRALARDSLEAMHRIRATLPEPGG